MKRPFSIAVSLFVVAVVWLVVMLHGSSVPAYTRAHTINPILGDISYRERFGTLPDSATDDDLRISTHLAYVLELLRSRQMTSMSPELKRSRQQNLDRLEQYVQHGIFPRNYERAGERRPCFIDRNGRICAVGYLVEQSAGHDLAEKINSRFQYDEIADMQMTDLEKWTDRSGLTPTELAMIQPSYGWRDPVPEAPDKTITKMELGGIGVNVMTSLLNVGLITMNKRSPVAAGLGIAFGAASIGLSFVEKNQYQLADVICGGAGLGLGLWNLILLERTDTNDKSDKSLPSTDVGIGMVRDSYGESVPALQLRLGWRF